LLAEPYDVVLNSFTVKEEDGNLFMNFGTNSNAPDPVWKHAGLEYLSVRQRQETSLRRWKKTGTGARSDLWLNIGTKYTI
jgi:hypothetical protein